MNTESLSQIEPIALLGRVAFELTIPARRTCEAETENVLDPQGLRTYSELLHRLTSAVVVMVLPEDDFQAAAPVLA